MDRLRYFLKVARNYGLLNGRISVGMDDVLHVTYTRDSLYAFFDFGKKGSLTMTLSQGNSMDMITRQVPPGTENAALKEAAEFFDQLNQGGLIPHYDRSTD